MIIGTRPSSRQPSSVQRLYDPDREDSSCGTGFIYNPTSGTHDLVERACEALRSMQHRAGRMPDGTGDGAGIVTDIPHKFFFKVGNQLGKSDGVHFTNKENFAVASVNLSHEDHTANEACAILENSIKAVFGENTKLVWRKVPRDTQWCGNRAEQVRPRLYQLLIETPDANYNLAEMAPWAPSEISRKFEFALFIARMKAVSQFRERKLDAAITMMSSRFVLYKGMLTPANLRAFFPDLSDRDFKAKLALIHGRFSTNALPNWLLAQLFGGTFVLGHNGEINSIEKIRKEVLSLVAQLPREFSFLSPLLSKSSDSGNLTELCEFLYHFGKLSLNEVMAMVQPGAFDRSSPANAAAEYLTMFSPPALGPALLVTAAGDELVTQLDSSGLRPARYGVTKDGVIYCASEEGVFGYKQKHLASTGILQPGKSIAVNTSSGCYQIGASVDRVESRYYQTLVAAIPGVASAVEVAPFTSALTLYPHAIALGWDRDGLGRIAPAIAKGHEPYRAMGDDTPQPFFRQTPALLGYYLKQRFAQVTNPALDLFRERNVVDLTSYLGPRPSILSFRKPLQGLIKLSTPILTNGELQGIASQDSVPTYRLDATCSAEADAESAWAALYALLSEAGTAIQKGARILIVSDRDISRERRAFPILLVVGMLNRHLTMNGLRREVSIVADTGEARDSHLVSALLSFGASAVNPYMMYALFSSPEEEANIVNGLNGGVVRIMSKMGISTIEGYIGAQLFEPLGLNRSFVDQFLGDLSSPINGVEFAHIWKDYGRLHTAALQHPPESDLLPDYGLYANNQRGITYGTAEEHGYSPLLIQKIQQAVGLGSDGTLSLEKFEEIEELLSRARPFDIRDLFSVMPPHGAISIDQVEEWLAITRRFATAPMSVGSLNDQIHEDLFIAMREIGGVYQTGEGGLPRSRYMLFDSEADSQYVGVQVAPARFGVTSEYLVRAGFIEIKIAQGAKPGEGGHLPGFKVSEFIAGTRYCLPGTDLLSPSNHHDIYSIEDLAGLIHNLRAINPTAVISVKLVASTGIGTIAVGVAKAGATMIQVAGGNGGTGSSPDSSVMGAGMPWELGLKEVHDALVFNGLRDRVYLGVDGGLKSARDIIIAAILGAERFVFGTLPLIAGGCTKMNACNKNTCVWGIATQDPELQKNYHGRPEHYVNFFHGIAHNVQRELARLGVRSLDELIGRTDLLEIREDRQSLVASLGLDLSGLLERVENPPALSYGRTLTPVLTVDTGLDNLVLRNIGDVFKSNKGRATTRPLPIGNTDRSVGGSLSGQIIRTWGVDDWRGNIHARFVGTAGQTFGFALPRGVRFTLNGPANDYVGKSLNGGVIVVRAPKDAGYDPHVNALAGLGVGYGATEGEIYIGGTVGHRGFIRNGATGVCEGAGMYFAEYQTRGYAVCLGMPGELIGSGMSGGEIVVYGSSEEASRLIDTQWVKIANFDARSLRELKRVITKHARLTGSQFAKDLLNRWEDEQHNFVRIVPKGKE